MFLGVEVFDELGLMTWVLSFSQSRSKWEPWFVLLLNSKREKQRNAARAVVAAPTPDDDADILISIKNPRVYFFLCSKPYINSNNVEERKKCTS